jgi:hypothetical protein
LPPKIHGINHFLDVRLVLDPAKYLSLKALTAASVNPSKAGPVEMIPTADPDACLGPGYSTTEFGRFSGDRRPTCALMNMAMVLLGKSASCVSYEYIFNEKY